MKSHYFSINYSTLITFIIATVNHPGPLLFAAGKMFLATRPISFTAHRPPLLFHRRNFRPISRKEHAEKALRLKASPRQQTFLASKRIAELDRNGKIVDAIACVVGHRAVERLSLAGLNTHFSPLTKSATSSSLPKQIPRIAFHRPEAWNTLLAALARRGMVEASWGVYTAVYELYHVIIEVWILLLLLLLHLLL